MLISKNNVIQGSTEKPIVLDFGYQQNGKKQPVVIFAHGFKGFKDWGHFNEMMKYFIESNVAFVKFNFSHNGGTVEQPIDFPDLEAFGNNNYSKELSDLKTVVDWIENSEILEFNKEEIFLIGHSRGGGISIIGANEDPRIKKLITWAAVSDLVDRLPQQQIEHWEKEGVIYVENGRTKQRMPVYYQLAKDTFSNRNRFDIESAIKELPIPHLIIHGSDDQVVTLPEANKIKSWNTDSELFVIDGADHVFGSSHPYTSTTFPVAVQSVLERTLSFINK